MNSYDAWFASLLGSAYTSKVGSDHNWERQEEYLRCCDESLKDLELVKLADRPAASAPPVVSVIHNESARLQSFLVHYRKIGVQHFMVIDHRSTDSSSDFLSKQSDVSLYRTEASYESSVGGQMWVTGLARRCALGEWVLHVDADELLVYDGMEQHGLGDLVRLLEKRGETRLYAPMIDMYPKGPITQARNNGRPTLLEAAPYFDPMETLEGINYQRVPSTGRAALMNLSRARRFGSPLARDGRPVKHLMDKFPLSLWHSGTAYCSVHQPYPFRENPGHAMGALLHFKFSGDFVAYNKSVARMGEAWCGAIENAWYVDQIERGHAVSFYHSGSKRYVSPRTLIDENFIEPIDWSVLSEA